MHYNLWCYSSIWYWYNCCITNDIFASSIIFLSQQIFNITSLNISQSAIPRLYAGKIGFYCCLMFTSFGVGLFLYDEFIIYLINPNAEELLPGNKGDIHLIMDDMKSTFLLTGILIFGLLIIADGLIYLSSITPKFTTSYDAYLQQRSTENYGFGRSPMINYNYIQGSPKSKRRRKRKRKNKYGDDSREDLTSRDNEYEISTPNQAGSEVYSSVRREKIYKIQQKFKSLKSPKLTYVKYLLDAGNNIHELIPTPITTPGMYSFFCICFD